MILYEEKTLKNGKTKKVKSKALLKQKVIITFSRKVMEYQRYIRNRQIERAKELLKNIDPDTYKKGPHDVTRFIKRISPSKSGDKGKDIYIINQSIIDEEEKYDGYYAIATNLDDDAKSIIEISSKRHKIEDCFRNIKKYGSGKCTGYVLHVYIQRIANMYSAQCDILDKKYYQPKELNKKIKKLLKQ